MRGYVFVDAENNFQRSLDYLEKITGVSDSAKKLSESKIQNNRGYPFKIDGKRIAFKPNLQLFWDCGLLDSMSNPLSKVGASIARAIYVCSCTGDDDASHEIAVELRSYWFEPVVVRELKNLKTQRLNELTKHRILEKPKGCDIAIATRMVADAAADLYDCCLLFTSDADFLPAVEAVRRMGKVVIVLGFRESLPKRSPYLHVPDIFFDLGDHYRRLWDSFARTLD